jgi:hypothetical protein
VPARITLDPNATTEACFLNSKWMSALDASDARNHLGFGHEPLAHWLPSVFSAFVARL